MYKLLGILILIAVWVTVPVVAVADNDHQSHRDKREKLEKIKKHFKDYWKKKHKKKPKDDDDDDDDNGGNNGDLVLRVEGLEQLTQEQQEVLETLLQTTNDQGAALATLEQLTQDQQTAISALELLTQTQQTEIAALQQENQIQDGETSALFELIEGLQSQINDINNSDLGPLQDAIVTLQQQAVTFSFADSSHQSQISDNTQRSKRNRKRIKALEENAPMLADLVTVFAGTSRSDDTITFEGVNLQIVNGEGATDTKNGLGNLIVGYNALDHLDANDLPDTDRSGSHNLVVGEQQNYSKWGGVVLGNNNWSNGRWATVTGGQNNLADGNFSAVTGGRNNAANGPRSVVLGGRANTANGGLSSVAGGRGNSADGELSTVSGGRNRTAPLDFNWVGGGLLEVE